MSEKGPRDVRDGQDGPRYDFQDTFRGKSRKAPMNRLAARHVRDQRTFQSPKWPENMERGAALSPLLLVRLTAVAVPSRSQAMIEPEEF